MSYITEQERLNLIVLAQTLEDARNTRGSVSGELKLSVRSQSKQSDLPFRLGTVLNPEAIQAAAQLGPWDTGYFTFASGIAVGGFGNLAIYPNGAFNFSGHFHVSGAISYDTSFVWAVKDSNVPATVYAFAHTGRVHGTFEAGSRDDDWGRSEINPAIAAGWSALARGWSWRWEARVNADFGIFLDDIIKVVAAGTAIGNVVKIFIG
jgi:hypothetical protein